MAEHQAQERTERATPKRLEDARRRGQVPRSPDLSAAAVVMLSGAALYLLGSALTGDLRTMMSGALAVSREQALDDGRLAVAFGDAAFAALRACAPVLGLTLLAALAAPLALGGWNFSSQAIAPDFARLSPLAGLQRMFSVRGLVELGKSLAKFALVALIAVLFLWQSSRELLSLGRGPAAPAVAHALVLTGQALLALAAGLVIVAAVDVPFQVWQHRKMLRMSREEVREELKESEGSPEVRGRIRSVQKELAKRRMMQEVPKADVVVTNPTHYAVALRYDERRMRAPVVVAKGVDLLAARIREVAAEHGVPLLEAPPLARALYRSVDLGVEIPASLYVAVAQVLTYVHQLRAARRAGAPQPPPPDIDPGIDTARH
jgi:flagellar biosynthetic protein FlhB